MILSKTDSLALIHKRLASVAQSLALLDGQTATRNALLASLAALKEKEAALIANDATTPVQLCEQRSKIDLLQAKIDRANKALLVSEEAVVLAAEKAGQLVYAFKIAAIESYYAKMEAETAAFFDKRDLDLLKNLSQTSILGKQIHGHEEFHFSPSTLSQRQLNIHDARRLPLAFDHLEAVAKDLDVKLDIPHTWLDDETKTATSSVPAAASVNG